MGSNDKKQKKKKRGIYEFLINLLSLADLPHMALHEKIHNNRHISKF